jgi:uncharacterized protein YhdP
MTTITDRILAAMREVTAVAKDGQNQQQGYAFRGADSVVAAMAPALRRNGIVTLPMVEETHVERIATGSKDTMMWNARVVVRYRFVGLDGDHLEAVVVAEGGDSADKAVSKAMTVAFRTALLQVFALPTQDVDAVTPAMHRNMMALLAKGDIRTTEARAAYASEVLGREIESIRDCTATEVATIISSLQLALDEPIHEETP